MTRTRDRRLVKLFLRGEKLCFTWSVSGSVIVHETCDMLCFFFALLVSFFFPFFLRGLPIRERVFTIVLHCLLTCSRQDFKKGIDPDYARRKRDEHGLRIRKEKREEKLQQKRKTGIGAPKAAPDARANDLTLQTRLQKIPQWLDMIRTADPQKQLEATTHFRKLLSIERNPPIQEVIACGVVPRLVEFLTFGDHAKLIFEAAWALTNIASGSSDQTRVVIDAGAVPIFVQVRKQFVCIYIFFIFTAVVGFS
jgi:hypothetical protein